MVILVVSNLVPPTSSTRLIPGEERDRLDADIHPWSDRLRRSGQKLGECPGRPPLHPAQTTYSEMSLPTPSRQSKHSTIQSNVVYTSGSTIALAITMASNDRIVGARHVPKAVYKRHAKSPCNLLV